MANTSKSRAVQRQELFLKQNGRCYWCQEPMTPTLPTRTRTDPPYPKTMCTLDHVVNKLDPRRHQRPRSDEVRRVAACLACNEDRSLTAQRNFICIAVSERVNRSSV